MPDDQPRDDEGRFTAEDETEGIMAKAQGVIRSDYFWSTAYEVGLAALIVGATVVLDGIGNVSGSEQLASIEWWQGIGVAALVAMANAVRAELPGRSLPDE